MKKTLLAVFFLFSLLGTKVNATDELQKIGGGAYELYLPSDFKKIEVTRMDSYVTRYENDSITISTDYGIYSNNLDYAESEEGYNFVIKEIDNNPAKIVLYNNSNNGESKYFSAVNIPYKPTYRVTGIVPFLEKNYRGTTLTVSFRFNKESDKDIVKRIIETTKVK